MYDVFLKKMSETIYRYRSANQYDKLREKRDDFINLSLIHQCIVLKEILNNFSCKVTQKSNLELLNMGKNVGANLTLTKNLNLRKNRIKLFNYSVTGLYCEKVDINGLANSKDK